MAVTAVFVVAGMASCLTPAFATAPRVLDQAGGRPCGEVDPSGASGGCRFRVEGEQTLIFHFFGLEATEYECHMVFDGAIGSDGGIVIAKARLSDGGHIHVGRDCPIESPPCPGSLPWRGRTERDGRGAFEMHVDMCIEPHELGRCAGPLPLKLFDDPAAEVGHRAEVVGARIGPSSLCEVDVSLLDDRPTFYLE